jgi:hypothetical protein
VRNLLFDGSGAKVAFAKARGRGKKKADSSLRSE